MKKAKLRVIRKKNAMGWLGEGIKEERKHGWVAEGLLESNLQFNHVFKLTFWVFVAPRSRGYGDATETYIRRAMVPSRMYAKHQYNTIHGSECGNTWCYTFQHKIVQVLGHHRL